MSDTPQLLLAHHLKALRLPSLLREYDKLAQQCAAEGVDHPRYLLRLADDDYDCSAPVRGAAWSRSDERFVKMPRALLIPGMVRRSERRGTNQ